MHHGMSSYREIERLCSANTAIAGRFGRVFLHLPPLYMDPDQIRTIGAPNGPMKDTGSPNLAQTVPLGLIFFGQFIDHDITLDVTSTLSSVNDPAETPNLRTPTLDLDCVYGDGPEAHPFLFDGPKLITGTDMTAKLVNPGFADEDLPRSAADVAIIGDPRNDENRVISQMQLGFLRFHNKVVDILAARVPPPANIVHEAQRIVRWHYQWIVVNDYLRTICGNWVVDDILANGRKIYQPEDCYDRLPFIPIEFAVAGYRYGHTMIAQKFRIKPGGTVHDLFGATLGAAFSPVTSADQVVEWDSLLNSGAANHEKAGALDTRLAKDLLTLPFILVGEASLATRNMLRGQSFRLPSGEQIAMKMQQSGVEEVTDQRISKVRNKVKQRFNLDYGTPFWLYILAEGETVGRQESNGSFSKGEGLGPAGARFVAETLIGLLDLDDRSYLGTNRNWSPTEPSDMLKPGGVRTLHDLLTF